jgi:broad specificity polyphosphatase/5'/3'-nucleotidase SurE
VCCELASGTPLPTDVQAIRDRYISLTPLQYNLTFVRGLSQMAARQFDWRPGVVQGEHSAL